MLLTWCQRGAVPDILTGYCHCPRSAVLTPHQFVPFGLLTVYRVLVYFNGPRINVSRSKRTSIKKKKPDSKGNMCEQNIVAFLGCSGRISNAFLEAFQSGAAGEYC